jgi:hypothetical protein
VKLAGVLAEIVADQEVKAVVEAEPLEELLPPPAQALMKIGTNTRAIFCIIHPPLYIFNLLDYKRIRMFLPSYALFINLIIKIVKYCDY